MIRSRFLLQISAVSLLSLTAFGLIVWCLTKVVGPISTELNNVYYLFSTLAQTISALVGLTIAGFAVMFSMLESAESRDETLSEINKQLKRRYFTEISVLTVISGLAITLDVVDLILNHLIMPLKTTLYVSTGVINLVAIILVVLFVIDMINPNKDKRTAEVLYRQEQLKEPPLQVNQVSAGTFMDTFIELEGYLRNYIERADLYHQVIAYRVNPKSNFIGLRDILRSLVKSGKISSDLFDELEELTRYRNLVVHARVQSVDRTMIDRVQMVLEELKRTIGDQ